MVTSLNWKNSNFKRKSSCLIQEGSFPFFLALSPPCAVPHTLLWPLPTATRLDLSSKSSLGLKSITAALLHPEERVAEDTALKRAEHSAVTKLLTVQLEGWDGNKKVSPGPAGPVATPIKNDHFFFQEFSFWYHKSHFPYNLPGPHVDAIAAITRYKSSAHKTQRSHEWIAICKPTDLQPPLSHSLIV